MAIICKYSSRGREVYSIYPAVPNGCNNNNNNLDWYSAFQGTQGRFTEKTGVKQTKKYKNSQTNSQTDKTTNKLGAEGLGKQMGLEGVKRGDVKQYTTF